MRYHSLVCRREGLSDELVATACSDEGEIMALRHRTHPSVGARFHPEAVLTKGDDLLRNFLSLAGEHGTSCAERSR
jgi:anthranilate/para-aminobenzoate synthase component II